MTSVRDGQVTSVGEQTTLGELVATATRDVSLLVRQEVELAKAELRQQAVSAGLGAGFLAVAGVLGFFAFLAITVAIAEALTEAGVARPWAYVLTAGIYLVLAGLLALFARNRLTRLGPPKRTMRTVQDDIAWIKHPTITPTTATSH